MYIRWMKEIMSVDIKRNDLSRKAERKRQMMSERLAEVGGVVIWHDPVGKAYKALVTAVWTKTCINVVIVSGDESKTDPYGRQIERQTSCTHGSVQKVHGFYWRFEDEAPNPYIPPVAV